MLIGKQPIEPKLPNVERVKKTKFENFKRDTETQVKDGGVVDF